MLATQLDFISDSYENSFVPELLPGDLVRFTAYYESDESGVGVIKELSIQTDPDSELFIALPCAIVVSVIPGEQWLDYVPLDKLEIIPTSKDLAKEYAHEIHVSDALTVFSLQLSIACTVSQYRPGTGLDNSYLRPLPARHTVVSFQGGAK